MQKQCKKLECAWSFCFHKRRRILQMHDWAKCGTSWGLSSEKQEEEQGRHEKKKQKLAKETERTYSRLHMWAHHPLQKPSLLLGIPSFLLILLLLFLLLLLLLLLVCSLYVPSFSFFFFAFYYLVIYLTFIHVFGIHYHYFHQYNSTNRPTKNLPWLFLKRESEKID